MRMHCSVRTEVVPPHSLNFGGQEARNVGRNAREHNAHAVRSTAALAFVQATL